MTEGDHPDCCHLNIHMMECCAVDIFALYHSSFQYWQFYITCKAWCFHDVSTYSLSKLPVGNVTLAFWDLNKMADIFHNGIFWLIILENISAL